MSQKQYLLQLNYIIENKKNYLKELKKTLPQNIDAVNLIGCGATLSQMYTLQYLLDTKATSINSRIINSGEAFTRRSKTISSNSVVVLSSHSGSTKETVKAAEWASDSKAVTIGITSNKNSKMAKLVDVVLDYKSEGPAPSESKLMLLYLIGFAILENNREKTFDKLYKEWEELPQAFLNVKSAVHKDALNFAGNFSNRSIFYVLGSGPGYGAAYAFSICKLMEMQWLNGISLNCGEFFHGPLEIVESSTPIILFKSEDKTRPLCDRVESFVEKYSNNLWIIDTSDFTLNGISKANREIFAPLSLWPAMNEYIWAFSESTGHDLDKRRYMGVVSY